MSMTGVLQQAHANGLRVATVLDCGAAMGRFSLEAAAVLHPGAVLLVEPLREFQEELGKVAATQHGWRVAQVAVSDREGVATFNVHRDLFGSSLLHETESGVDGEPRSTPCQTVDALVAQHQLAGPFLLKLDLQGGEIAALNGATRTLGDTAIAVVEVSLFHFIRDGPLVHDIVALMRTRGFVLYDVAGMLYRPVDGALAQMDLVFVPENGPLRNTHVWATPQQRRAQDAELRAHGPAGGR